MHTLPYQRPPTLYRYAEKQWLERALLLGEFRLRPVASTGCLAISFSKNWNPQLFTVFSGADSCLVIHDTEAFGERLHHAVQKVLPSWMGIDGAVEYGTRSPLGAAFSKSEGDAIEQEWQFAWRSTQAVTRLHPITVQLGNIENYAQLRDRDEHCI